MFGIILVQKEMSHLKLSARCTVYSIKHFPRGIIPDKEEPRTTLTVTRMPLFRKITILQL